MNLLDLNEEKFKTIVVQDRTFRVRFISPMDRVQITRRRMNLQDGKPVECLTQDEFTFFENVAINDVCIEDYPKDLKKSESCMNWLDASLINEVAFEIKKHTSEFEEKLKKNKPIE